MNRECSTCGYTKPIDMFNGRALHCKACAGIKPEFIAPVVEKSGKSKWSDPEFRRQYHRDYYGYRKNVGEIEGDPVPKTPKPKYDYKTYQRKYQKIHQLEGRLRLYNLTLAGFNMIKEQQGGKCMLCFNTPSPTSKYKELTVSYDTIHDHVRGLICFSCKIGMGCLRNDPALLRRMADHLEQE